MTPKKSRNLFKILLRYLPVAALFVTGTFSCANSSDNTVLAFNDSLVIPKDSAIMYFRTKYQSEDTVFDNNSISPFENKWYSRVLFSLHEPVMYSYTGTMDIYRFTWLRSFHNPFSFRIEKRGTDAFLNAKEAYKSRYSHSEIIIDTTIRVTQNEWNSFIEKLDRAKYWEMPIQGAQCDADGADWILEGVSGKRYHVSVWCSPSVGRGEGFYNCCKYLLELSGIKIPKDEMY